MVWIDNDLTAFAGGSPAFLDGSSLGGYVQSDGSQHVNFTDDNGHVHELYRSPTAQWVDNDLTAFSGGTPAYTDSALPGYSQSDGSQHVHFIDDNGHVHELYRSPTAQWVDNDLTAFSGGTPASTASVPLDAYAQSDGGQHVNFIDASQHVHELYRNPAAQWVDNDLTAFSGGALAIFECIGLDGYAQSDGSQHVNFIDASQHVHELYRSPTAQWVDNDLTALSGGTPASPYSSLDGYSQSDNSQHVNFIAGNIGSGLGHVHELYRSPTAQWVDNDLTEYSGGAPALLGGTGPLGEYSDDGSQHVNFFDVNEHVHELYRNPTAQWVDNDITTLAAGTVPANGSALRGYSESDGSQHINFFDGSQHVHELYNPQGS